MSKEPRFLLSMFELPAEGGKNFRPFCFRYIFAPGQAVNPKIMAQEMARSESYRHPNPPREFRQ